jgi:hypothetical protein
MGYQAGYKISTGTNNVAVGDNALAALTTGTNCTAMGSSALAACTGGTNTAVGSSAGSSLTTGTGNTLLGYNAQASSVSATNQIVIGSGAVGTADNQIVLGNSSVTSTVIPGLVTSYRGIATAGGGIACVRASGQFNGQIAAVATIATYTPAVDTTLDITCSALITTSGSENFTLECAYTDAGNTARVMTIPLRILTGANVLIINNSNGAIPYAGALSRIRVKGGTAVTLRTQAAGTYTGCTYNIGGGIRDGS